MLCRRPLIQWQCSHHARLIERVIILGLKLPRQPNICSPSQANTYRRADFKRDTWVDGCYSDSEGVYGFGGLKGRFYNYENTCRLGCVTNKTRIALSGLYVSTGHVCTFSYNTFELCWHLVTQVQWEYRKLSGSFITWTSIRNEAHSLK